MASCGHKYESLCVLFKVDRLFLSSGPGSADGAGESSSLHAVCGGGLRLAFVRLLQPLHCALQAQRRLVRRSLNISPASGRLRLDPTRILTCVCALQLQNPRRGVRRRGRRPPRLPLLLHPPSHRTAVQRLYIR